jgi:hypothetical protein
VLFVGERVKDSMVGLGDFVKRKGHVTNRPTEHRCRPPDIDTVLQDERSAVLPMAPTRGRRQSPQGGPVALAEVGGEPTPGSAIALSSVVALQKTR